MTGHSDKGVPLDGAEAMRSGWAPKANPHPMPSPERLEWEADWHGENAACFRSHVESRPVKSWKQRAQEAEAGLAVLDDVRQAVQQLQDRLRN